MAMITPKVVLGLAAGLCGTIFVGYCIYFDQKRHKDPNFKRQLCERRQAIEAANACKNTTIFPDLKDHEAVQAFFLKQIQLGESCLKGGMVEDGVYHMANAVAVCGQPKELLNVLQQTLPVKVFNLLLQKLQSPCILKASANNLEEDVE